MSTKIHYNISFPEIIESISDRKYLIITDKNLSQLYSSLIENQPHFVLYPGEGSKSMKSVMKLIDFLIENHYHKDSILIGYGGGVVTDLVGFAASIYKRGTNFMFIPTTLMAQIDASLGGKNGINHNGFKNVVGVINQPQDIFINTAYLNTLSKRHFFNGIAEIIKYGVIYDVKMLDYLENNHSKIIHLDKITLNNLIKQCIKIKWHFYHQDLYDNDYRNLLNFGHTVAHFIELSQNLLHGEAVAIGLVAASEVSYKLGKISKIEFERIINLVKLYHLPSDTTLSSDKMREYLEQDKKNSKTKIRYIILETLGKAKYIEITIDELMEQLNDLSFIRFN